MTRVDYFRDPSAPLANSVVPSVTAVVRNRDGDLLLIHKTDNDLWALPGGGHDIGEGIGDTVAREVEEETGIRVTVEGISGLYTDPEHVMAYDDGEVRQQFSICFRARPAGGELRTSSESKEVRWATNGPRQPRHPSVHAAPYRPRTGRIADGALHRLIRRRRVGEPPLYTLGGGMDIRGGAADEPGDDVTLFVPLGDLREPSLRRGVLSVRRRRHVAEDERIHQLRALQGELRLQLRAQAPQLGLQRGA